MKCNIGAQPENVAHLGIMIPNQLPGLPYVHNIIRETRRGPGYHYHSADEQHQSPRLVVQLTLAGRCQCVQGETQWDVGPGKAICFQQPVDQLRVRYPADAVEPLEILVVGFGGQAAAHMLRDIADSSPVLDLPLTSPVVQRLQAMLSNKGWLARRMEPRQAAEIVWDLLATLAESHHQGAAQLHPLLSDAMDTMLAQLAETSVSGVARALNTSRVHLDRLFREQMGIPPGQWLRQQRLRSARALMRDTTWGLDSIAQHCGFGSATSFIAAFRQQYGQSPGKWRSSAG